MKKVLPIIVVVLVSLLGIGGFWVLKSKKTSIPPISVLSPEEKTVEVPLEERPYVVLIPRADGREFTMEISNIKDAKTIEYELVYLSQGLSRGVVGAVDLAGETKISRKLLLGTCSRNVCKYDEGIEEGTLTLRLRGPEGTRKFSADFYLQKGTKELTTVDEKFKFIGKLPVTTYYLTMSTIGLPGPIEGEVVGGPYGIFTSGTATIKGGQISFGGLNSLAKIYSWTGKNWQQMKTAEAPELTTFIAVLLQ